MISRLIWSGPLFYISVKIGEDDTEGEKRTIAYFGDLLLFAQSLSRKPHRQNISNRPESTFVSSHSNLLH